MTIEADQLKRLKENTDLRKIASLYTGLRRESATEDAGPCPKCGGEDRFHAKEDWFFCRQCNPNGGDAVDFLRWAGNMTFPQAVATLGGDTSPNIPDRPIPPAKTKERAATLTPDKARYIAQTAAEMLYSPDGEAARAYLEGRGLYSETWETFGLGYSLASLPGTWDEQAGEFCTPKRPAICIPWTRSDKQIPAIRYRFLTALPYTDTQGKQRTEKQTAQWGSNFSGLLFGGCALSGPNNISTVILTEGEINAMSIWQATAGAVDVLSLGSESAHLTEGAARSILRYARVIIWTDKAEIAQRCKTLLPTALAYSDPNGRDANDWLRAGILPELIIELIGRIK